MALVVEDGPMRVSVTTCVFAIALAASANATDRFFPDIHSRSRSGRFRVDATSPDNEKDGFKAFQAHFTYSCLDTATSKTLWTRKQAMHEPRGYANLAKRPDGP